jgi:hypothetical protein
MDAQGPPTLRTTGRSGTRKPGPGETQSIMRAAVTEVCDYSYCRVSAGGHQLFGDPRFSGARQCVLGPECPEEANGEILCSVTVAIGR